MILEYDVPCFIITHYGIVLHYAHSFQIQQIVIIDIFACSGRMNATSGDLESSHCALSIGCSF